MNCDQAGLLASLRIDGFGPRLEQLGHIAPPDTTAAAMTLLYKKKDRKDIRNYRPITLLNADLKLLTAALA